MLCGLLNDKKKVWTRLAHMQSFWMFSSHGWLNLWTMTETVQTSRVRQPNSQACPSRSHIYPSGLWHADQHFNSTSFSSIDETDRQERNALCLQGEERSAHPKIVAGSLRYSVHQDLECLEDWYLSAVQCHPALQTSWQTASLSQWTMRTDEKWLDTEESRTKHPGSHHVS